VTEKPQPYTYQTQVRRVVNGEPDRVLSEAEIEGINLHVLLKDVERTEHQKDWETVFWRALITLLRSNLPLSRYTRDWVAADLERLHWPNPNADRRTRHQAKLEVMRHDFAAAEAINRWLGIKRPRSEAKDAMAKHWDYSDGEAFRKALQPGRRNRRPGPKPR
jgi:hypothetical protein